MSFKERVIEICEANPGGNNCLLKCPCNKINDTLPPEFWSKGEFDSLKQHLKEYHAELSEELTVIEEMLKEE